MSLSHAMVRTWRAALTLLLATSLIVACGGGSIAGIGSGGTGSFAFGPIAGLGSIIVGDIRYDDATAQILGEDDEPASRDALALGVVVEVAGSTLTNAPVGAPYSRQGDAHVIRFEAVVVGPLESVDLAAGVVNVFGQRVVLTAGTVFAPELAGGLPAVAALPAGTVLTVHGFVDAATSGRYTATRIARAATPAPYRLRGIVHTLDAATRSFSIGDTRLSYAGREQEADLAGLANGRLVHLRVLAAPDAGGRFPVDRIRSGQREIEDRDDVEIEGRITRFASPFDFDVEGIPVNASGAEFDDDDPSRLALGVRVEIEGRIREGVLIAEEVEIEDEGDGDVAGTVSLEGRIEQLNLGARTFVLRGYLVRYGPQTNFDDGNAADLANGVEVEVEGQLSADGVIDAIEIEFDD